MFNTQFKKKIRSLLSDKFIYDEADN